MPEVKHKLLIPAVGATVLVGGTVAAFMYFKSPAGENLSALASAELVPATAVMTTYMRTDTPAWGKLQEFGTPEAQKIVKQGLENFSQSLLSAGNISYQEDLKPWVGSVMLAVLPASVTQVIQSNQPDSGNLQNSQPQMLMVVGIKDRFKALSFANKLRSQPDVTIEESNYQGETITAVTQNGRLSYSAILNNQHLVFSSEKPAVKQAIATFKGEPSFAGNEDVEQIFAADARLKNNQIAQVYIPNYAKMIQQLLTVSPRTRQLPPETWQQFKQVKSLVADVGVDEQGVRMQAIANLNPQFSKFEYQISPGTIVGQLPANTLGMMTGQSINRTWSKIVEQATDDPQWNQVLQMLRGQLQFVNIDVDQDVFGWMNEEFALAAIPSNQGILGNLGIGAALLLQTSDRQTAATTLSKLDNLAKIQRINITQRNINGTDVTEWLIPGQRALLSHGWLNDNTVFLAVGSSVAEAIATKNTPKLDTSDKFKTVTESLPKPNAGYFYIDVEKTASLINRLMTPAQPLSPELNTVISTIDGFSVTLTSPEQSSAELEILLALKPKTAP
jgi:hypothetical protein